MENGPRLGRDVPPDIPHRWASRCANSLGMVAIRRALSRLPCQTTQNRSRTKPFGRAVAVNGSGETRGARSAGWESARPPNRRLETEEVAIGVLDEELGHTGFLAADAVPLLLWLQEQRPVCRGQQRQR